MSRSGALRRPITWGSSEETPKKRPKPFVVSLSNHERPFDFAQGERIGVESMGFCRAFLESVIAAEAGIQSGRISRRTECLA